MNAKSYAKQNNYLTKPQIQEILLEILKEFDAVCRDHGIRYSLDGGTLLGAVRHGGFIPWDDDVDVIVPRPDYERLLKHPEWFKSPYLLQHINDPGYFWPYAKLFDTRFRAQEPSLIGTYLGYLWLDIFPVDSVPSDEKERNRLIRSQKNLMNRASRAIQPLDNPRASLKYLLKRIVIPIYRAVFPAEKTYLEISRNAQVIEFGSTPYVAEIVCIGSVEGRTILLSDFDNLIEMKFENSNFLAIQHWDDFLSSYFGEYMCMPPKEKRVNHAIEVWRA